MSIYEEEQLKLDLVKHYMTAIITREATSSRNITSRIIKAINWADKTIEQLKKEGCL